MFVSRHPSAFRIENSLYFSVLVGRKECAVHAPRRESRVDTGASTPPRLGPTLERHSSSRQNKRLLMAGAHCLLSKMNQTLQKLGWSSAGCAVSPRHIPFLLPPSTSLCIAWIPSSRSSAPAGGSQGWPDTQRPQSGLQDVCSSGGDRSLAFSKKWMSLARLGHQGRKAHL